MTQSNRRAGSAPLCCPTYTVMPGDTVASVAAAQSVVPSLLTAYNKLPAGGALTPGQVIQIPCARTIEYAQKAAAPPAGEKSAG